MTQKKLRTTHTLAPLCAGVFALLLGVAPTGCAGDGSAPLSDGSSATPQTTQRSGGSSRRGARTPMYAEQHALETSLPGNVGVRVESDNGPVELVATSGETVRVAATVFGATPDRAKKAQPFTAPDASGDVSIGVIWPDGREAAEGSTFRVEAPHGSRLIGVRTSAGAVRINDMRGDATVRTTRGEVVVTDHEGPLDVETTLAQITVRNVTGPVVARTTHGLISIHGAASTVHSTSYNAGVDVRLTPDNPGPVFVETTLGAVNVEIGPAFTGEIELRCDRGSLQIDAAFTDNIVSRTRDRALLRFGDADVRSNVTTTGATIRLKPVD